MSRQVEPEPRHAILNPVPRTNDPTTAVDCAKLLEAARDCLDAISTTDRERLADRAALAAMHVQQALDLIGPADRLEPKA